MQQFDVYANSDPVTKNVVPLFLVLQCELFRGLDTRMVVPLVLKSKIKQIQYINPLVKIGDETYVALFNKIGHLPNSELEELISNVESQRSELQKAYDFIFQCS